MTALHRARNFETGQMSNIISKAPKRVDSGKKGTKLKLSKPKTPNGTPVPKSASKAKSASASKTAKPKGSVKKSAVKVKDSSDEDAVEGNTKSEEKPMTVAELQAKKEKEILWLRYSFTNIPFESYPNYPTGTSYSEDS